MIEWGLQKITEDRIYDGNNHVDMVNDSNGYNGCAIGCLDFKS